MTNDKTIIWDWNGTLINDTEICIKAMNKLLKMRNMKELNKTWYRDIFTFPVKDYYKKAGFDFSNEPFEIPAMEFINNYHEILPQAKLFNQVEPILIKFKQARYKMLILSAMEEESLIKSVTNFGIAHYFDAIIGINNHFARSKTEQGKIALKNLNISIKNTVLIGDTLHDKEVANALGCKCILVANGHQSFQRLKVNGNIVCRSLLEAKEMIEKI